MGLVRVLHACLGYLLIFNIWMCSWSLKGFPACDVTQAMSDDYKAIYNSTVFLQKVPTNALLSSYLGKSRHGDAALCACQQWQKLVFIASNDKSEGNNLF